MLGLPSVISSLESIKVHFGQKIVRADAKAAYSGNPFLLRLFFAAHGAGATPEEIYSVIDEAGGWAGGAARQNGMEAWRLVFRPDLPTLLQVVELTDDSLK